MFGLDIFTRGLNDKPMHFNQINLGTKLLDDPSRKMQRTPALPKVKADIGPSWLLQPIADIPTFRHAGSQDSDYMRKLFPERGQPIYEKLLKAPVVPRRWSMVSPGDTLGVKRGAKIVNLITPRDESLESILSGLRKVTQPPQETDVYNESTTDQQSDRFDNTSNQQTDRLESVPQPIPVQPVLTGGFEESKTNHDIPRAPLPPRLTHHLEHQTLDDDEEPQPVSYKSPSPEPKDEVPGVKREAVPATEDKPKEAVTPSPKKRRRRNKAPAEASEDEPGTERRYGEYTIDGWMDETSGYHLEGESILEELKTSEESNDPRLVDKCIQAIAYAERTSKFLNNRYKQESEIPGVHKGYFTYDIHNKRDLYGLKPVRDILTTVSSIFKSDKTKATIGTIRRSLNYYTERVSDLPNGTYQRKYVVK